MVRSLCILGSTGSIGVQALEVSRQVGIEVMALTAKKNIEVLERQAREFKPKCVAVLDESAAKILKQNLKDTDIKVLSGTKGICAAASETDCDMVLNAVMGMAGLLPTLSAIESKKNIALANKETLVAGGEIVKQKAREYGVKILPVDSEHSAIFQCLEGCRNKDEVKNIILTASGGPFFGKNKNELLDVTASQALRHPNWSMGNKITIDSATMMNKGLEIIEAAHLFDVPEDKIKVVVHRESIVHSMVEFRDNSVIAQMGVPSMKIPIQYALTYPERADSSIQALDLVKNSPLTFYPPDEETFESMNLCRRAFRIGGTMPAVLSGANEQAVELFLNGKIKFLEIAQIVESAMNNIPRCKAKQISDIIEADRRARAFVKAAVGF